MDDCKKLETEQETMERFDSFVRATLLEEGNRLHKEKGCSPLTEDDLSDIDTLSELKEAFGEKTE